MPQLWTGKFQDSLLSFTLHPPGLTATSSFPPRVLYLQPPHILDSHKDDMWCSWPYCRHSQRQSNSKIRWRTKHRLWKRQRGELQFFKAEVVTWLHLPGAWWSVQVLSHSILQWTFPWGNTLHRYPSTLFNQSKKKHQGSRPFLDLPFEDEHEGSFHMQKRNIYG